MKTLIILLSFVYGTSLFADRVTLVSGEVLEGEILGEDTKEITFETARTRSRSHRIVHHLSHDVVRSISRGNPRPEILPEVEAGSLAIKVQSDFENVEYNAQELKDALAQDDLLDNGQYDAAIAKYQMVAEQAYEATKVETNVYDKAEFLTLQQNAYDLWIVAIKGKVEAMEEKENRLEDALKNEMEAAEEQLDELRDRVAQTNRDSRKTVRLGSGRTIATAVTPAEKALLARVDRAKQRLSQFDTWRQQNGAQIKSLEAESDLIREKSSQIKDDLSAAKRAIRDQERIRR